MVVGMNAKFKIQFFDRRIIQTNWKRINKTPLSRAGSIVRSNARGSITRAKKGGKPRPAGFPPKSRQLGATPPFKMIFNVPVRRGLFLAEMVGMVGFGNDAGKPIPQLQEEGGSALRRVFITQGQRRTKKGRFRRKIRKPVRKIIQIPKRPFMLPALERAAAGGKLAGLWKGSLGVVPK